MHQSAAEKVRLKLEQDILTFVIKPGERLDETRLADIHGVSRTPVREALRQLSASGLVEMRPHRGTVAKRLSLGEIVEMFETMAVMEGVCARLAAKRAMVEHLRAIREAHEACRPFTTTEGLDEYYRANEHFHESIYRACGNSVIIKQTLMLRDRLKPFRRYHINRANRLPQSYDEHARIVICIEQGAAAEADQLIQDHLSVQSAFISNLMNSVPRDFIEDEYDNAARNKGRPQIAAALAEMRHAK